MGTTPAQMDELIERHLAAEAAGDVDGAIAVYTDDVEHDVVGSPTGVAHGREGARGFYEYLVGNIKTETTDAAAQLLRDDACTIEHVWTGTVPGEFLGIPGNGRRSHVPHDPRVRVPRRPHQPGERLARRQRDRRPAHGARPRRQHELTRSNADGPEPIGGVGGEVGGIEGAPPPAVVPTGH